MAPVVAVLGSIGTALGAGAASAALVGGLAVAGTAAAVGSLSAQSRAAQASQAAVNTQRQQAQQQATFERRRAIRQFLMERQLRVNLAAAQGLEGGSAAAGGIGSMGSQLGTNLGYGSLQSGLSNKYFGQTLQAQRLTGQAQLLEGISNMAFGFAGRVPSSGSFDILPSNMFSATATPRG